MVVSQTSYFCLKPRGKKRNKWRTKKKTKKKKKKKAVDLEGLHTGWRKNMGRSLQGFVGRQRSFVA